MKISEAFKKGAHNVLQSKRYVLLAYVVSVLLALVLAVALSASLTDSLGNSLAGENLRKGFDPLWYSNFSAAARGLSTTFEPGVVGIGAVLKGLDQMLGGEIFHNDVAIAGVGILYLLLWTFFSAGFISLYAASEGQPSFVERAAAFFPRFLLLAALAGVAYFLLFYFVLNWLNNAVEELTRETIDERVHFAYVAVKYGVVWLLVVGINLIFDYSKIFVVLKNHANALSAPWHAMRTVFSNFGSTFGLYLSIGAVWVVLMLLYWLVAPGAGQSSWLTIAGAFFLGQIYLLVRIGTRCLFYAGQTAMFEAVTSTDHESDGYTA